MNAIMKWTEGQYKRLKKFILDDDMDCYEEYTIHLKDEEQKKFFAENPNFMSEYPISRDNINLLKDPIYKGMMGKIMIITQEMNKKTLTGKFTL